MSRKPHVLAIAYPTQGHMGPLMKLSQYVADQGVKVTFVCPESMQPRVLAKLPESSEAENRIEVVSISEGFKPGDDRKEMIKMSEAVLGAMPMNFEVLLRKMNLSDDEKITCVLADVTVAWALKTAEKLGIKKAGFWPSTEAGLALLLYTSKLIKDGIVDQDGNPLAKEAVQISPELPAIDASDFIWSSPANPMVQKHLFEFVLSLVEGIKTSNWLLCNSFYELNPAACDLIPNLSPIGPLPAISSQLGKSAVNFWPEDSSCLNWLDKQPERSVHYIAFGSVAILSQHQFDEIALGLELSCVPFLWVVRSDLLNESSIRYPDGFLEQVSERAKVVEWAPQQKVLGNPSVAGFFSHCGWNSTMEGLSAGVPFLCLPYVADQFINRTYVCDVWKIGLGFDAQENGVISRHEISTKVKKLLSDAEIRANALKLKEMARKSVSEVGSSFRNFGNFIEKLEC